MGISEDCQRHCGQGGGHMNKLRDNRGETLVESLVSILIAVLAFGILVKLYCKIYC